MFKTLKFPQGSLFDKAIPIMVSNTTSSTI